MKTNQKGFSVVEILIVIVVVGLLGAVGWLVYDRQKSKSNDKTTTQTTQQEQKQEPTKQETKAELATIKTTSGFSLSYPKLWSIVAYQKDESASPGGQVDANDPKAIQWRIVSNNAKSEQGSKTQTNGMCVELRVSNAFNAGMYTSALTKTATTSAGYEIWSTSTADSGQDGIVNVLRDPKNLSFNNYILVSDDVALTANASFSCGIADWKTTYTGTEQLSNKDYIAGLEVLKSVTLNN